MRKIVYIDMDDTLFQFKEAHSAFKILYGVEFPQGLTGFWLSLNPIEGAVEAVNSLRARDDLDVHILTAPSVYNPHSYMEKRQCIEKHFDYEFCHKLILSPDKGLLKGHFLIDDCTEGKGQEGFDGQVIQFGSDEYPDWDSVILRFCRI